MVATVGVSRSSGTMPKPALTLLMATMLWATLRIWESQHWVFHAEDRP